MRERVPELPLARVIRFRDAFGVGVRFLTENGNAVVPIRVDFAVGYENWRISAGISEAF